MVSGVLPRRSQNASTETDAAPKLPPGVLWWMTIVIDSRSRRLVEPGLSACSAPRRSDPEPPRMVGRVDRDLCLMGEPLEDEGPPHLRAWRRILPGLPAP